MEAIGSESIKIIDEEIPCKKSILTSKIKCQTF